MIKKYILIIIIYLIPTHINSQKLIKKSSSKLCKCLEKNEITSLENINPCLEQVILKDLEVFYDYYNVQSLEDVDFEKFGNEVAVELSKSCDYFMSSFTDPMNKVDKNFIPKENLSCKQLRKGNFYYLTPNYITKRKDTTFVSINNKTYIERMNNGKTYSLLEIDWVDDCSFNLIFQESNDPLKSTLSKIGDKYNYEVIDNNEKSCVLKLNWKKQEYKFEFYKVK